MREEAEIALQLAAVGADESIRWLRKPEGFGVKRAPPAGRSGQRESSEHPPSV